MKLPMEKTEGAGRQDKELPKRMRQSDVFPKRRNDFPRERTKKWSTTLGIKEVSGEEKR